MLKFLFPLASALIGFVGSVPQAPPNTAFNGPGRYQIENVESGLLLDVAEEDHETVQQYPRRARLNQLWDIQPAGNGYFTVQSAEQGKFLSLARQATREGTQVVVSPGRGGDDQLWQIVAVAPGEFQIISKFGGALDVPRKSHEKSVHLQVWTRTDDENQRFRLIFVSAASRWGDANSGGRRSYDSRDMDADGTTQACRVEVLRHLMDLRSSDVFVDLVSSDANGDSVVLWKTPRSSSGFCRVDRGNRVTQFKVEEVSR